MSNYDEILAHVLKRIDDTPIIEDPYPHILVENIFPQEFYNDVIKNLVNLQPGKSSINHHRKERVTERKGMRYVFAMIV